MDLTKVAKLRINNIVDWNRDTSFFTIKHRIINFEDEVKKKREIKLFCRKWLKCIVNKQMLYLLSKDNDGTKYKIQIEVYQSSGTAKIFKKKVNTETFQQIGTFDIVGYLNRESGTNLNSKLVTREEFDDDNGLLDTTIEGTSEPSEDEISDFNIIEFSPSHQDDENDQDEELSTLLLKLRKLDILQKNSAELIQNGHGNKVQ
jgi:hypothetical protein